MTSQQQQQQQQQQSESEVLLVRYWLLSMQRTHGLYNVNNKHQCLRDSRRPIVRPFQYAPNFYGCTICGQYHICHLREQSCVVVQDSVAQRMTCQYSGQLLHQSEALVQKLYDDASDSAPLVASANSTNTLSKRKIVTHSGAGGSSRQRACYTNMRNPFAPSDGIKRTRDAKRISYSKTCVSDRPFIHRGEGSDDDDESGTTATMGLDKFSIGSIYDVYDDDGDDDGDDGGDGRAGSGDNDGDRGVDGTGHTTSCVNTTMMTMRNTNVTYHPNYKFWTAHFSYLLNIEPPDTTAPVMNIDAVDVDDDEDKRRSFDAPSSASTATPSQPFISKGETLCANPRTTVSPLDISLARELNEELSEIIKSIVEDLLKIQLRVQRGRKRLVAPVDPYATARLQVRLSEHYVCLVKNIATVVYASPVIKDIRTSRPSPSTRDQRIHQRQPTVPHMVITPLELCLALMLRMFTRPYKSCDTFNHVIELWSPDVWFCALDVECDSDANSIVTLFLHERRKHALYKKEAALYDRAKMDETAIAIKECIDYYQGYAQWLSDFIATRH
jgi:hypothetical protein